MSPFTEQELITLLQAKQKKGFDLLYDRYGTCLYLLILKIVKDQVIAEEVLEESIINIWQHMHEYDSSKGNLLNWLLTITRHTALARIHSLAY